MVTKEPIRYRRHIIRTLKTASGYQARAFRGSNVVGQIQSGDTFDVAVMNVKRHLDDQAAKFHSQRGFQGFPCAEEVRIALAQISMNKAQEMMLAAHLAAPSQILTASQLAAAAGYDDYAVANRLYGQLGYALAEELEWTPKETRNGVPVWTFTLAFDADEQSRAGGLEVKGHWRWRLRPEVVEALS